MEGLLDLDRQILELKHKLTIARILWRLTRSVLILTPLVIGGMYIATALTWREFDMGIINTPLTLLILAGVIWVAIYFFHPAFDEIPLPGEVSLELTVLQERRRIRAASLSLSYPERRAIYKNDTVHDLERFRGDMNRYRRIHNTLQALIIIGSLTITTFSGMLIDTSTLGLAATGSSLAVGVAAGFTGYYKFRERSFHLQQTADGIEQEWNAVDLGIGRYKDLEEDKALAAFTAEVEHLKAEQQKREQNLDQPSHGNEAPERS